MTSTAQIICRLSWEGHLRRRLYSTAIMALRPQQTGRGSRRGFWSADYLWSVYFAEKTLAEKARTAGFKDLEFDEDVCGSPGDETRPTLAVL